MGMSESIAELRARCQAPAAGTDTFYTKHVARRLSIHLTRLVLRTPMSANQVTAAFLIFGWVIGGLFALGSPGAVLLGACLLHGWFVLDCVDGEVARYRKTSSLAGMYLDHMGHAMVRPFLFAGLGVGLFRVTSHPWILWSGVLAAVSAVLVPLSTAMKASVTKDITELVLPRAYFPQGFSRRPGGEERQTATLPSSRGGMRALLRLLPKDPAVINLLTLASLVDVLWWRFVGPGSVRAIEVLVVGYAGLLTMLWVKTVYNTVVAGIDAPSHEVSAEMVPGQMSTGVPCDHG
jgi:hypothetical protein